MNITSLIRRARPAYLVSGLTLLALLAGTTVFLAGAPTSALKGCPAGYVPFEESEGGAQGARLRALERKIEGSVGTLCIAAKHPESFAELSRIASERAMKVSGGQGFVPKNGLMKALRQREAMATAASAAQVPGTGGKWRPYGKGSLISNDPDYPDINGLGLVNVNGRVDSIVYDEKRDRLFALIGTGGVWLSEDMAESWKSIGDKLPSQIGGAIGWSEANGGTIVMVSGEHLMGGNTYTGYGAYYTTNLGKTWHKSKGVPTNALGWQVAVDPTNEKIVFVATSRGLFRSTDGGKTFANAVLPTGDCAGKTDFQACLFTNFVTDVVIQSPDEFGNKGGEVLAAVGYRAGPNATFPDGTPHACCNGLYHSKSGKPGTFELTAMDGFAAQERIGRTELGVAYGPEQNHDYVYAIVQDAVVFAGGFGTIDAVEPPTGGVPVPPNTVLNGIYVSDDFGQNWTLMADENQISENPATGSALVGTGQAIFFAPGVQAWYNEWVLPDPTRHVGGVPTRLVFGLEEMWQNELTTQPQDGQSSFKVIGRYFSGESCILLDTGVPFCPTDRPPSGTTTTHPDQHHGTFIPTGDGGVHLLVGNDGGVYKQTVAEGEEFDNGGWGEGNNDGFHTLLPYDATMAKDGTVWYGMQDNGSGKIEPGTERQVATFGGDGFFTAVDPDNSDIAYSETPGGIMRVTTDGGFCWKEIDPGVSDGMFSMQFAMDRSDANHLVAGGGEIVETTFGPETDSTLVQLPATRPECPQPHPYDKPWEIVYDLGGPNVMSAIDVRGSAVYAGFCGICDILSQAGEFHNGIATNVGGDQEPEPMTSNGWHKAEAKGLANRYINSLVIDDKDPETVYVALGGYSNRQWVPVGSSEDPGNPTVGKGHVFRSTDAGKTFKNISGNLPDTPVFWIEQNRKQLVVGTEVGVFLSKDLKGDTWALLEGLPNAPISTIQTAPQDEDLLVVATFGRGVYTYMFPEDRGGGGPQLCPGQEDRAGKHIIGTPGADRIKGTKKRDVICGRGGNDKLIGGRGNDWVGGGKGDDVIKGKAGSDTLRGRRGLDHIFGGKGDDFINGGDGKDVCDGGEGKDKVKACRKQ